VAPGEQVVDPDLDQPRHAERESRGDWALAVRDLRDRVLLDLQDPRHRLPRAPGAHA